MVIQKYCDDKYSLRTLHLQLFAIRVVSAPSIFQNGILGNVGYLCYIDDIMIGGDSEEKHLQSAIHQQNTPSMKTAVEY